MTHQNPTPNGEKHEAVHAIVQATLEDCIRRALELGIQPVDLAHSVVVSMLTSLATSNDEDNICVLISKRGSQWKSHIHYDYLSADHDHFKGDFMWDDVPEPESRDE